MGADRAWACGGSGWFGMLKVVGEKSATSIIADTVYFGSPEATAR